MEPVQEPQAVLVHEVVRQALEAARSQQPPDRAAATVLHHNVLVVDLELLARRAAEVAHHVCVRQLLHQPHLLAECCFSRLVARRHQLLRGDLQREAAAAAAAHPAVSAHGLLGGGQKDNARGARAKLATAHEEEGAARERPPLCNRHRLAMRPFGDRLVQRQLNGLRVWRLEVAGARCRADRVLAAPQAAP
eukprot:5242147-Prymnesium_polylepis.1